MIKISCNQHFLPEKQYAFTVLFTDILKIEFEVSITNDSHNYIFELPNGNRIEIPDSFFSLYPKTYLVKEAIPPSIQKIDFETIIKLPILFGDNSIEISDSRIQTNIDIIASIFFMTSRWEEFVISTKDSYGRFPFTESLAYKHNFIQQPIVNMYAKLFSIFASKLQFEIAEKHSFTKKLTHDIDYFYKWNSVSDMCKTLVGDIVKRKSIKTFITNCKPVFTASDPYDTIETLMSLSESISLKSTFYFLVTPENKKAITSKSAILTCNSLVRRGHNVGLHYNHYKIEDSVQMNLDTQYFESIFHSEISISRQHFLQFQYPETFRALESCGITQDSSMYYREALGFRTGCCVEHSVFDVENRCTMHIKELPLICMDVTLLDFDSIESSKQALTKLLDITKEYNGQFVCLWHNSSFDSYQWAKYAELYSYILSY